MRIEKHIVFRVGDRDFRTLEAARASIDDRAHQIISKPLLEKGFTVSEMIKITDAIFSVREALAPLLVYGTPADEDACSEDPDGQHFIGCGCE